MIDAALQRVGNTTQSLIAAARVRLNKILFELRYSWDWPFLFTTAPLVIPTSGSFALPENFAKMEDDQSLLITATGGVPMRRVVTEVDHRTFYTTVTDLSVDATVPVIWTIDYSQRALPTPININTVGIGGVGLVYPRPRDACQALIRYKLIPPDMPLDDPAAYDNDIPGFPFDNLIVDLLFEWAMSYEVDPRRGEQYTVNADAVNRARGSSFPERSYPSTVQLDPLVFSKPWQGN
jgi:hypothetical protein